MNRSTTHSQRSTSRLQVDETDIAASRTHEPAVVKKARSEFSLCCYQNQKSSIQVVRSSTSAVAQWHLERVVFPGQRLMFYAPDTAKLKVYNGSFAESLLSDTIPCDRLKVEGNSLS